MKLLLHSLRKFSYPLLGLLFLLFVALFFFIQGAETKKHIAYLEQLRQLEKQATAYSMALFQTRFRLRSDYDELFTIERAIEELLAQLHTTPSYLNHRNILAIHNLIEQMKIQFEEKQQHVSRFKSAKALYGNSIRYLPLLHDQIEVASETYEDGIIYATHVMTEDLLAYLASENNEHKEELLERIYRYQLMLNSTLTPQQEGHKIARALLRHSNQIITNQVLMEESISKALTTDFSETTAWLRTIYLSGYKIKSEQTRFSTQLLVLFTLTLFITLIGVVMNLRRTYQALEQSHSTLEQRVQERTVELGAAKAYAEKVTHSMKEALLVTDGEGLILSLNPATEQLTGYKGEQLVGQPLTHYLKASTLEEATQDRETTLLTASGLELPIELSHSLLEDANHPLSGIIFVFHDISERKHVEQQQQFLAYQSGISEMGVTVMHNIGNITTGMTGNLTRLKRARNTIDKSSSLFYKFHQDILQLLERSPQTEPQSEITLTLKKSQMIFMEGSKILRNTIEQQIDEPLGSLTTQTQQIGGLIKLHKNETHPNSFTSTFDLHALIVDVIALETQLIQEQNIQVEINIAENIQQITLPRNQMMQMLVHMLQNSITAIQDRYSRKQEPPGKICFHSDITGESQWFIQISDNGIGIPEKIQSEIFNFGYSTQQGKTGYGLHSVGNFVQSMKGKIEVESSEERQETQFTITFHR
jgi:PAS domain S-box-containing protein